METPARHTQLPGYAVRIILLLLFLVAAGARFYSTSGSRYPYFKGSSAMTYRDAGVVQAHGDLDSPTRKSNWPEGYRPARVRPVLVEYVSGYAFRVGAYLSEIDMRRLSQRWLVFFFSLAVFTSYGIARRLWRSQAAGLVSAGLVAVFSPLAEVTNGSVFAALPFVLVLVSAHVLALSSFTGSASPIRGLAVAVLAFLVVSGWELGSYYIVAVVGTTALLYPGETRTKRWIAGLHLVSFLLATMTTPHLRALRLGFSWQTAAVVACFVQTLVSARFPGVRRGGLFVLALGAVLTAASTPFRSGATESLPALEYAFHRIRFLLAKPVSPSMLPVEIRYLWTADHAGPSAHALLTFYLPVVLCLPAVVFGARSWWRRCEQPSDRARLVLSLSVAVAAAAAYAVDRSAVSIASLAVFPVLGLGVTALGNEGKWRSPLVAVGAFIVLAQMFSPSGRANPTLQLARATGIAFRDSSQFLWVSLENTDLELVRFVSQRTSVSHAILGRRDITALLLAFSGRTSVLLAGARSPQFARREAELTALLYGGEHAMYRRCRDLGVDYVLYSIDALLDTSPYSPAYLAGVLNSPDSCVAAEMHFSPASLEHFGLVYENDHYRLFKVVETPEPIFLTDHPPAYQRDILERNRDSYGTFRERIDRLLIAYSDAIKAKDRGETERALGLLGWSLNQAPGFTKARVAYGSTLLQAGRIKEARDVLLSIIQYAPDNALALYYAAYALAELGETERAQDLLAILFGATNDTELRDQARLLQAFIEQGIPLTPGTGGKAIRP